MKLRLLAATLAALSLTAGAALAQQGETGFEPVVRELAEHLGEAPWLEVSRLAVAYTAVVLAFSLLGLVSVVACWAARPPRA